jgi:hypothetical protein
VKSEAELRVPLASSSHAHLREQKLKKIFAEWSSLRSSCSSWEKILTTSTPTRKDLVSRVGAIASDTPRKVWLTHS